MQGASQDLGHEKMIGPVGIYLGPNCHTCALAVRWRDSGRQAIRVVAPADLESYAGGI